MLRKLIVALFLIICLTRCEETHQVNIHFEKLVDKEWVSQNGFDNTYHFFRNNEFTRVWKYQIFNPATNEITEQCDTVKAFWKLNDNAIIFYSTQNISDENEVKPTDWVIVELSDNLLKVKLFSDIENPYILPWVYSTN